MNHSVNTAVAGLALASLGLFLSLPERASAADDAGTVKALQGTWHGFRYNDGKGDNPEKGVELEFTIKENHIKAKRIPDKEIGEGEIKISADGKNIDATGASGRFKDKAFQGILKIDGDKLLWCTATGDSQERPADFVADPNKKTYLIIVKRQP